MLTATAFREPWLDAPFSYPRDARYVAAARLVRSTRWAWFEACREPVTDFPAWRRNVDRASAANTAAIQACRDEEERILAALADERVAHIAARASAGRQGGAR